MTEHRVMNMATKQIAIKLAISFSQTVVKLHSVKINKSLRNIIPSEFKNISSD